MSAASEANNEPLPGMDYWGQHPDYPAANWAWECKEGHTRLGYWAWVRSILEDNPG